MTRIVSASPEKIVIEFEKRLELHDGHKAGQSLASKPAHLSKSIGGEMMDSVRRHILKYPNARTSKLSYLAKRDETTAALQRYVASKMPWWKRLARALGGKM